MPRFDQTAIQKKLADLVNEELPQAQLLAVSVRESATYDGEPSLAAEIIFREIPAGGTTRPMARVIDRFRTWLSTEKDEERFPYVRVFSEQDKRELEEMKPESGPSA
ncbi:MAG TPA: hypothetical protein VN515_06115 [Terriglobales bacterium]|nr:hypothetical protein [Terriglobales bacterium]